MSGGRPNQIACDVRHELSYIKSEHLTQTEHWAQTEKIHDEIQFCTPSGFLLWTNLDAMILSCCAGKLAAVVSAHHKLPGSPASPGPCVADARMQLGCS